MRGWGGGWGGGGGGNSVEKAQVSNKTISDQPRLTFSAHNLFGNPPYPLHLLRGPERNANTLLVLLATDRLSSFGLNLRE